MTIKNCFDSCNLSYLSTEILDKMGIPMSLKHHIMGWFRTMPYNTNLSTDIKFENTTPFRVAQ